LSPEHPLNSPVYLFDNSLVEKSIIGTQTFEPKLALRLSTAGLVQSFLFTTNSSYDFLHGDV